jgi:hypothetical protein
MFYIQFFIIYLKNNLTSAVRQNRSDPVCLHTWELSNHFLNKVIRNLSQMLQNLSLTLDHISLMIRNIPLLTETVHEFMALWQVVTRNSGKEMMIYLILQSSAEPVHKSLGDSTSSNNISGGGYLQLPEIGTSLCGISRHTIVSKSKNESEEETRGTACSEIVAQ